MKIFIFDGTFKATTFINRLINGLAVEQDFYILGFNETINDKIPGVKYIGLGSNSSWFLFIKRSIALRRFNFFIQLELFNWLLKRQKKKIINSNIQLAIDQIKPGILNFQWRGVLAYYTFIVVVFFL